MPKGGKYTASAEETKGSKKVKLSSAQKQLHSRAKTAALELKAFGLNITFSEDRITHSIGGTPNYYDLDRVGEVLRKNGLHWNTTSGKVSMPKKAADAGITYVKINEGDTQGGQPITKVTNSTVPDGVSRQQARNLQAQYNSGQWGEASGSGGA